jgi:hypothetical protein
MIIDETSNLEGLQDVIQHISQTTCVVSDSFFEAYRTLSANYILTHTRYLCMRTLKRESFSQYVYTPWKSESQHRSLQIYQVVVFFYLIITWYVTNNYYTRKKHNILMGITGALCVYGTHDLFGGMFYHGVFGHGYYTCMYWYILFPFCMFIKLALGTAQTCFSWPDTSVLELSLGGMLICEVIYDDGNSWESHLALVVLFVCFAYLIYTNLTLERKGLSSITPASVKIVSYTIFGLIWFRYPSWRTYSHWWMLGQNYIAGVICFLNLVYLIHVCWKIRLPAQKKLSIPNANKDRDKGFYGTY